MRSAAATAAPDEIPARMPSSAIRRRAVARAVSLSTVSTRSMIDKSKFWGIKPAPMP